MGVQWLLGGGWAAVDIAASSNASLIERMEREIARGSYGQTFARMKAEFPEDYRSFMDGMVALVRRRATDEEAFSYAEQFMREFVTRHMPSAAHADSTALFEWVESQIVLARALAATDVAGCANVMEGGPISPAEGMATAAALTDQLSRSSLAMFDAIVSGRRSSHVYQPLNDAEWLVFGQAAIHAGADERALAAVGTPEFSGLSDEAKCSVGVGIFGAIAAEPDPILKSRYAAQMLRSE